MTRCLFVSDLHGHVGRYDKLCGVVEADRPALVLVGGDLMPHAFRQGRYDDFLHDVVATRLRGLRNAMGSAYPEMFVILGNDDPRSAESAVLELERKGLWHYVHNQTFRTGDTLVVGYAFVPPTPFLNKDWEKYDVSRYVPPGSVSPEEGFRSVAVEPLSIRHSTIEDDLGKLAAAEDLTGAVVLFHTPPHETRLDRLAADGKMVDHVPLDLHVGSIAVRRFIERRQPLLTLHGHIHESTRLSGYWRDRIGRTHLFSAAHDGPELCIVRFDLENLESAERLLL